MGDDTTKVFRFGDYEVDVGQRELRHRGEQVITQPRVFNLLVHLIEHRDRAVDKDELQDAVWPGVIVTETALTRAVMKARRAVGDDANSQTVIKTLHGHGYRFVAELGDDAAPAESPEAAPAAAEQAPSPPDTRAYGPRWWLAAAAAIGTLALGLMVLWPRSVVGTGARVAVLPVINATGEVDLAWTSLGLMSFASGLIETGGDLAVVPDSRVVGLAESFEWSGDLESERSESLVDRLRRAYGATHIVAMRLERGGGNLRITHSVLSEDGRLAVGTMVGQEVTELARGVVRTLVSSVSRRGGYANDYPAVSADYFVNEAYARGMSLSLEGRCGEARRLFQVAIDHEAELFAPRYQFGVCSRILGEWEDAEETLAKLVSEQRPLGASRQLALSLMSLGVLYNRTGRLDPAHETLSEALDVVSKVDAPELAGKVLNNLAIVAEDRGEFAESRELLGRALVAYHEAGRKKPPGTIYGALANLAMDQGKLDEAEGHLRKALDAFRFVGDRRHEAMMLNNFGYLKRQQGRFDEAEDDHLQSLRIREEIGDKVGVGRIHGMLSFLYRAKGRYSEAKVSAEQALAIARETKDRLYEGTSLAQLGDAELGLGEVETAARHYGDARQVFVEIQDKLRVLQSDLKLAEVDLRNGNLDRAEGTTRSVLAEARAQDLNQPEIQAAELLADIAAARGETQAAIEHYANTLARVQELSWGGKETEIAVKLAQAHLDQEDLPAAEPLVGLVTQQPQDMPSLKLRARFAFMRGDASDAAELMDKARAAAGDRWTGADEKALNTYRESVSPLPGEDMPSR